MRILFILMLLCTACNNEDNAGTSTKEPLNSLEELGLNGNVKTLTIRKPFNLSINQHSITKIYFSMDGYAEKSEEYLSDETDPVLTTVNEYKNGKLAKAIIINSKYDTLFTDFVTYENDKSYVINRVNKYGSIKSRTEVILNDYGRTHLLKIYIPHDPVSEHILTTKYTYDDNGRMIYSKSTHSGNHIVFDGSLDYVQTNYIEFDEFNNPLIAKVSNIVPLDDTQLYTYEYYE